MTQRSSIPVGPSAAAIAGRVLAAAAVVVVVLLVALLLRSWLSYTVIALLLGVVLAYTIDRLRARQWEAGEGTSLAGELDRLNQQLTDQTVAAARVADRASRLQRFSAVMLERVGAAGVATLIVEEGRRALGASAAAVVIVRENGAREIAAAHGIRNDLLKQDHELYDGSTPLMDVLESGVAMWFANEAELLERYPRLAAYEKQSRAWAALPLKLDGRRIGALGLGFADSVEFTEDDRAFMLLVAQQCAQALDRARLHDMELRARVRAEFAERRLALLAEASSRLAASLDYLASLANLAQIAVPEIADWCVIHLNDEDGVTRLVAAAHTDAEQAARRRRLEEEYPASVNDRAAFAEVLRTGSVIHMEPVTDEYLRGAARDDRHYEIMRSFGVHAQLSVPLVIEDRTAGVVTLANAESNRRFSESDITLAQELGRRAGIAVENARLYQAAHHASVAKSDFLAVMSHELRTPLNAIIGYSDLLLMGVPDDVPDRAQRQIQRIRSASTSLLHLVEEVLSFSRVEAGKEDIRISPVDVGAVARECAAMIEPLAAEKGLAVRIDDPETPLKVVSDERKIRQILTNLLSNAVKFTESGTLTITVAAQNGEVTVEVRDTGIGIAPENLDRIFEPFWQVEQSSTRRFGGTGLGLGVARKLAKLLEGRLEVTSTVGEGSAFTLVLPAHIPGIQRLG